MSLPISGFTAVPNPQMLAFMAAQSFVMMMQAGEGWQYGKRKQSAMTNEEFNKQTPLTIMERQMSELKQAIPSIERSMNAMTPMIKMIVEQYGDFAAEIVKAIGPALANATGGSTLGGDIDIVAKEINELLGGPPSAATIKKVGSGPQFLAGASAGTAWVDPFMQSMSNFWNSLAGAVSGNQFIGPLQEENTPTDTFQNIQDLQKQIESGSVTVPDPPPNPASRAANPWTKSQLQKLAVVESGKSPMAERAVASFKAKIDDFSQRIKVISMKITGIQSLITVSYRNGRKITHNSQMQPLLDKEKLNLAAHVKQLGSLRTKFRSTYGYYY